MSAGFAGQYREDALDRGQVVLFVVLFGSQQPHQVVLGVLFLINGADDPTDLPVGRVGQTPLSFLGHYICRNNITKSDHLVASVNLPLQNGKA